jgi:hypothetical protein
VNGISGQAGHRIYASGDIRKSGRGLLDNRLCVFYLPFDALNSWSPDADTQCQSYRIAQLHRPARR